MKELSGKTVLVTGSSRGIGAAIARIYADHGMRVMVHFHANEAAARETLASLSGEGHYLVQADVANAEQVREMVEQTCRRFGRLDVLVNNAGIYEYQPFDMPDFGEWRAAWDRTLD